MDGKLQQGSAGWFEMVGQSMCEAALQARLAPDLNLTFVERYTDGTDLPGDRVQGIRFDIIDGRPSFRMGVCRDEPGDITIEITAAAARTLNLLHSGNPDYRTALEGSLSSGSMRVYGDARRLGTWLETVHDSIVERTT
ncbi:hypothetical protein AMC90_PA00054 (plasmid) [Rhizobium phaseoli]|uniref:SCP2 domain-containing protein n=1 Tax=Rhizobium phaseoli TaxID=396 RepID=A0ABN4QUN6_9HYPH|nr:hypothetical protein [Rhizobium phaseoli]ANL30164.1 hypothetical protein AMC90_PA00054 [Rhizobium phaseoli]ANL57283.1 hypothetical protein AMC86_PD00824 [Rhizobium phaseoli]ANL89181.1 hypothetical protein AMC81_PE00938 [Rhizobium phaseoli]ANL95690.1 hypothetical protein AMC80_PE00938 [Rhizobium phaseoli]PWI50959.1 hypothetical protein B5K03_27100 [Rhizobium phaseoli]